MPTIVVVACALLLGFIYGAALVQGVFEVAKGETSPRTYLLVLLAACAVLVVVGRAFAWW